MSGMLGAQWWQPVVAMAKPIHGPQRRQNLRPSPPPTDVSVVSSGNVHPCLTSLMPAPWLTVILLRLQLPDLRWHCMEQGLHKPADVLVREAGMGKVCTQTSGHPITGTWKAKSKPPR
jgi:hypothetical protein